MNPDVLILYIDNQHARNFIDLSKLAQPNPRILYVLHENGAVLRAWDSKEGKAEVGKTIKASVQTAEELRSKHQVDEVQLIDRETYQDYFKKAMSLDKAMELNGYDFKQRSRDLKGQMGDGFIIHPAREDYDYYHYINRTKKFIEEKLPADCVFLLGVYGAENWWTSGVVVFKAGQITQVSTFELFPGEKGKANEPATHNALLQKASVNFKSPSFGMFLSKEVFEKYARNQWRGLGNHLTGGSC